MTVRKSPKGKQTNLRHVWLASLGAVAIARRGAGHAVAGAVGEACRLRGRVAGAADAAVAGARGVLLEARERAEVLASVLERVGRAPGKSATRKPQRRATRKPAPARKSTSRSAAARKQAERRVAAKGR